MCVVSWKTLWKNIMYTLTARIVNALGIKEGKMVMVAHFHKCELVNKLVVCPSLLIYLDKMH